MPEQDFLILKTTHFKEKTTTCTCKDLTLQAFSETRRKFRPHFSLAIVKLAAPRC